MCEHIILPTHTTTCQLFLRFWLRLLIIWPLIIFFVACVMTMIFFAGFLFGRRPPIMPSDPPESKREFLIPYRWWPTALGYRLYPGLFLIGELVVLFISSLTHTELEVVARLGAAVVALMVTLIICVSVENKWEKSSTRQLIAEHIRGWKTKSCPIVTFSDEA
ncbi:MAG: hypothetical protein KBC02_01125 [Candidatus Pacebacteria bacterium]|nr:hypothetical protein [Candidatus Paceibacterota bacterium]